MQALAASRAILEHMEKHWLVSVNQCWVSNEKLKCGGLMCRVDVAHNEHFNIEHLFRKGICLSPKPTESTGTRTKRHL